MDTAHDRGPGPEQELGAVGSRQVAGGGRGVGEGRNEAEAGERRFDWHPTYRGQTFAEVTSVVREDLASDQRAYSLAMSGPDEQETAILVRIVPLERKWGIFAMDWATQDAAELAERVASFEWEREQRREMIPYGGFLQPVGASSAGADTLGDEPPAPWWMFWRR